MKVYYLRFTESDFIKQGDSWITPVVDLYNNSQYKNYSTTKSALGLNSFGNNTWTGLEQLSPTTTDFGEIYNGRFIDTSSRVDIVSWDLSFSTDLVGSFPVTLSIYNSSSSDNSYLGDWASKQNITPGSVIFTVNSNRYAFFQLNWSSSGRDLSGMKATLYIRVEIDSPGINALTPEVVKLQNKFPEWMAMREYDAATPDGTGRLRPSSIGGQFLNAVVGEHLSDLRSKLTYTQFQTFVETADLDQKAWVYETANAPSFIYSITGDGVELARVSSVTEFYGTGNSEDAFLWNEGTKTVYCNKKYTNLTINGETFIQRSYQVWNTIDDIGVTVDLFRLSLESNDSFRKRILDVYKNAPGVSVEAFKKAIRRELNLWKYYGATPNSDFLGATPELLEMGDIESNPEFFDYDGMPKDKFLDLVDELAKRYPITWGFFRYGQGFWDIDGLDHDGIQELPRRLDATPVSEAYLESGVGDGNDLYIFRPDAYTGARTFNAKLKVRGRQKSLRAESPAVYFDAKVYGIADEVQYSNPANESQFTIEIVVGGVTYYSNIKINATNDISYWQATPSSHGNVTFTWINQNKYTDINLGFRNKTTDALYGGATPSQIRGNSITTVTVYPGSWNYATGTRINAPTQANYRLWFSDNPTDTLGFGGSPTSITITSYSSTDRNPLLVYESRMSTSLGTVLNGWTSLKTNVRVKLNGANPGNGLANYTVNLPPIPWPSSTSNRRYVVELVTSDGTNYGAYSDATSPSAFFINSTYLKANGSNSWTSGKQYFAPTTTAIEFSTGTGAAYPIQSAVWSSFESKLISNISGVVDENGPWRNNQPQYYGNSSYVLDYYNLTRDDFGIPNTTDYILTWIGVDSISDPQVIVWTDTNTLKPAVTDSGETEALSYSENAVEEEYNPSSGKYEFNSVVVKARYKPGVTEQWYPKAMSGYFYDDTDEYYMYASREVESATANFKVLKGPNRLGAPVIVKGMVGATPKFDLRQVAFWESDATPELTTINTEKLRGNGSKILYAAYADIYNISVKNLVTGNTVSLAKTFTSTNEIQLPVTATVNDVFEVKYKVARSFFVDNEYLAASPNYKNLAKVTFDSTPSTYGAQSYEISYEGSIFDPATPIDIPLNTFYTSIDEGFIFIDHDVHSLARTEIKINPGKILADGYDYCFITLKTFDEFGNPKPYQYYKVSSNYGILDSNVIKTDRDGFGYATLRSYVWGTATPSILYDGLYPDSELYPNPNQYPLSILQPVTPGLAGIQDTVVRFELMEPQVTTQYYSIQSEGNRSEATVYYQDPSYSSTPSYPTPIDLGLKVLSKPTETYNLTAIPSSDHVPANGFSEVYVFGQVRDSSYNGVPAAVVFWRKDRYLYDLFKRTLSNSSATPGKTARSGRVIADKNGRFRVGPFVAATPSNPGFWLVSVESEYATPSAGSTPQFTSVGDIVYWQEYTDTSFGVENISGLPTAPVQYATPYWKLPDYSTGSAFPVTYDEATPTAGAQNPNIVWTPPKWYAIDKYTQYQMGLLGNEYWTINKNATPSSYKDYKEF